MAPKEKTLLDALRKKTISLFNNDPTSLTVRRVRESVIEDLDLDDDFFTSEPWKTKSKESIQAVAVELNDPEDGSEDEVAPSPAKPKPKPKPAAPKEKPAPKKAAVTKKLAKRAAPPKKEARPAKKAKRDATSSDDDDDDLSSEGSFGGSGAGSDDEESAQSSELGSDSEDAGSKDKKAKPAPQTKRAATKRKKIDSESEDEDSASEEIKGSESDASEPPAKKIKKQPETKKAPKKTKPKPAEAHKTKSALYASDSDDNPKVSNDASGEIEEKEKAKEAPQEDSESEMSVVLDEPPRKKRQKNNSKTTTKAAPKSKSSTTVTADLSPDDQHLKTLLAQLKKCGIKKIYQFTLTKEYGDDIKGKIKFLQKELRDVGMTGKFSESRAREIKEQRELLADLEAVKEGEKAWGVDDGGRRSRKASARTKNLREVDVGSEDEEGSEGEGKSDGGAGEDDGSGEESKKVDTNWARKDLVFLEGDEDESD